jgi:hypothetical protein
LTEVKEARGGWWQVGLQDESPEIDDLGEEGCPAIDGSVLRVD